MKRTCSPSVFTVTEGNGEGDEPEKLIGAYNSYERAYAAMQERKLQLGLFPLEEPEDAKDFERRYVVILSFGLWGYSNDFERDEHGRRFVYLEMDSWPCFAYRDKELAEWGLKKEKERQLERWGKDDPKLHLRRVEFIGREEEDEP